LSAGQRGWVAYRFGSVGKWAAGRFSAWAAWLPPAFCSLFSIYLFLFCFLLKTLKFKNTLI
jgi:hypothetical protein